jgi:hypothetical protein
MVTLNDLEPTFQQFENLDSNGRKEEVRMLEGKVKAGNIAMTDEDFHLCTSSGLALRRILGCLMVEHARVPASTVCMASIVSSEMDLVHRAAYRASYPRMPLYYAVRAYVARLRADDALSMTATKDVFMLKQFESRLMSRAVDRQGSVLPKLREAISLLEGAQPERAGRAIESSRGRPPRGPEDAHQSKSGRGARPGPWRSGSLYLVAFVVVTGVSIAAERILKSYLAVLPVTILAFVAVGLFLLKTEGKLDDPTFAGIIKHVLQALRGKSTSAGDPHREGEGEAQSRRGTTPGGG